MSFAQERLWFLEQFEPNSSVFNLCRAVRISGALNLRALESSLNEILRRQESLRTKITAIDGIPVQTIAAVEFLRIAPMDLGALTEGERETESRQLILQETKQPFDLAQGRLLRVRLLRMREDEHILIFSTHHIVSDAWSMGIFTRELWSFYDDFCSGRVARLPELSSQYRDYAIWQRDRLKGEVLESQLVYWKKRLADVPVLELPTVRPRASKQSFEGARIKFTVPKELTAALNALSKREDATLFITLLAAFQLLLYRYSGQEDIVVGSPVANRDRTTIENLIGFFVNTLVFRTDLSGAPSFRELLRRVREVCLDAYAYQEIPFEKVVEELKPHRELNRNPLFQVMFVLQNTPARSLRPPGLKLESFEAQSETAQFDLSLYLRERGGSLLGFFEYATDIFDNTTIERMALHFQKVLAEIVTNPDQPIATLPLLADTERHQLLIEWNETHADYPEESCIHELFEAQVERTPNGAALEFGNEKLTYRELNGLANRLAHHLANLGVEAEKPVGVMLERSFEMVISLLAIFKAGGAYVPLDPAYPKERLSFMLKDAEAGVLITRRKYADYLGDYLGRVVLVDELSLPDGVADSNLDSPVTADNAAYVIYTSGSTGTPKGVVGLHRGAVNRFAWMWKSYPFSPGEKNCQKTSLSFVDSVWEIFGALLQGVPTIIVPERIAIEPELLAREVRERRVTRLVLVPSLLREMLDQGEVLSKQLAKLKYCFSSGEVLPVELAARFREILPDCRLINLYGSSEVAGDVTCYEVGTNDRRAALAIGRPIANTQIYLLDSHLQPVPVGARGELYVGGENLARGYLKRPDLTAEKFIANPFSTAKTSRLYRTGDLARFRADGNLEFLGRIDNQVKIRGCRIEPSEIDSALNLHPAVRQCLVIARQDEPRPSGVKENPQLSNADGAEVRLVAYVVPRAAKPSLQELRSFLKERLLDSMFPSAFVFLDDLPLLPNGKVDRRALLQSEDSAFGLAQTIREPRTEIESMIAAVWECVLKVERIGADDNFFELGGHSLLAAQVVARLRAAFNKPISLPDMFSAPTVAGLAGVIENTIRADQLEELPPIMSAPRQRRMPLSASQEQLFLFSQLFGGGDFLNMPYAYRLSGRLDVLALKKAIAEIVRRHDTLRSFFSEGRAGPIQTVRRSVKIDLPIIDLSGLEPIQREQRFEQISRQDAGRCFDVEKAPLLRSKLLRLADDEYVLLVTMHHIVCDQWSMAVFRRELAELYAAYSRDLPSPLPDLPIQFADWVHWQHELLKHGCLNSQIGYWRSKLGEPSAPQIFRWGKKGTRSVHFNSARHPIEIDNALLVRVKTFARDQQCTPFMVFVAALNVLLHRYTGQSDIRIGTLAANRGDGTEGLIGYFVNALILRTRFTPDTSYVGLVRTVREVCLEAYAHQDLPFEHLEALLQKTQKQRRTPLYQVMLNYRNFSAPAEEANGLAIASWNGKNRAADPGVAISRLDVNIHLREVSTKLTGAVNYKTDLFSRAAIAEFVADYGQILRHMTERPDQRISAAMKT